MSMEQAPMMPAGVWGQPQMSPQLAAAVGWHVGHGWRVESAPMPGQVVVVSGRPVNHILHLLLTVLTMGLWGLVWLLLTLSPSESRAVLTVQPDGSVTNSVLAALHRQDRERSAQPWYLRTWPIVLIVGGAMALVVVLAAAGSGS